MGIIGDNAQMEIYIANPDTCLIFPDGDTCSFLLAYAPKKFRTGGASLLSNPIPYAFANNTTSTLDIPFTMQALPISGRTIKEVKEALVLCVFRGIPDDDYEAAAIWTLLYHKICNQFTAICGLPAQNFDLILHRRRNTRMHYQDNRKIYENLATVYCRPGDRDIPSLKTSLGIGDGPAEISLDWIGEMWGSLNLLKQHPPSMLLLNRTPFSCIHGCSATTTINETVTAMIADNPSFPLSELAYLWMAPYGRAKSTRGLHLIWKGEMRDIQIGRHLSRLGYILVEGDHRDNPSMQRVRDVISGTLVHHQFIHQSPNRLWITATNESWKKHADQITGKMPTLTSSGILRKGSPPPLSGNLFSTAQPMVGGELSWLRETVLNQGRLIQALQQQSEERYREFIRLQEQLTTERIIPLMKRSADAIIDRSESSSPEGADTQQMTTNEE